jgi:hypothetical protein
LNFLLGESAEKTNPVPQRLITHMRKVQLPIHPLLPFVPVLARVYYASTAFGVTVHRLNVIAYKAVAMSSFCRVEQGERADR